jgi:hypothetical protein
MAATGFLAIGPPLGGYPPHTVDIRVVLIDDAKPASLHAASRDIDGGGLPRNVAQRSDHRFLHFDLPRFFSARRNSARRNEIGLTLNSTATKN